MANGLMAGLIKLSAGHNTKKLTVLSPVNTPRRDPKRTFLKGIILDFTLKKKQYIIFKENYYLNSYLQTLGLLDVPSGK